MSRFTKGCLAVSSTCFVVGIGLCIAGWVLGYTPGSLYKSIEARADQAEDGSYKFPVEQEYENISSLELSLKALDCRVLAWEGDTVRVETEEQLPLEMKKSGSSLKIECSDDHSLFSWINFTEAGFLRIYVPEELILDSIEVEAGAVNIEMNEINCRDLSLEVGAGSFSYQGEVTRKAEISCGAGSVELALAGAAEDFDYEMSCGLGAIEVEDGPGIAGFGETKVNNKGSKKLEMECGMGSISVSFDKRKG